VTADSTSTPAGAAPDEAAPAELAAEALRLVGIDAGLADVKAVAAIAAARAAREPSAESTAWRARGLAARETEQLELAEQHLRTAVRVGRRAGKRYVAEARMSLALVLLGRGELLSARRLARLAVAALSGGEQARARVQLALIEQRSGALREAFDTYASALVQLRRANDLLWEARLRNNRGILQAYQGKAAAADRDLEKSEQLYLHLGQPVLAADVLWNRGFAAGLRGDAVSALRMFGDAGDRWDAAGVSRGVRFLDQCQLLLSVGLVEEAQEAVESGITDLVAHDVGSDVAEASLLLAETLMASGKADQAHKAATEALASFERQGRTSLALLARYAILRATVADPGAAVWSEAAEIATALGAAGWPIVATDVTLLMTQRDVAAGRPIAPELLRMAARATKAGPAGQRMRAWYALALGRLSQGDDAGASRALLAGLRVHEKHLATMAATELQVRTAARAHDLAKAGFDLALKSGSPSRILAWAERWRAGSLLVRPVQPPRDPVLAAQMSELRAVTAELEQARLDDVDHRALDRRQRALERRIVERARTSQVETRRSAVSTPAELATALGETALIELVQRGEDLAAVVIAGGRSSLHGLGSVRGVQVELEALRFGLGRLARGVSPRMAEAVQVSIAAAALRLDQLLLAPLASRLGLRPLVIVPTAEMHVLPWALLASARDRPVTVAPSASVWLHSRDRRVDRRGHVALVTGPNLPAAVQEIAAVAKVYPHARVLTGAAASVGAVMEALEGAALAHVAAHGRFRSDNPLFSSLQLADGPLTVYDLENLRSAPSVVVLSACESALSSVHPGDEVMGLTGALLRMGTRALVASTAPVPDDVARDTMVNFHASLVRGAAPAVALVEARAALDPAARLRAGAFVCFGAG
jgi:CHAT domain-containing protein